MPQGKAKREKWDMRTWICFTLVATAVLYGARSLVIEHAPKIVYSESESLSHSVFIVSSLDRPLKRGDYVTFSVPGNKYMGNVSVTKQIVGVGGDTIEIVDRVVFVNGVEVGLAKPVSRAGEELFVLAETVVPEGRYFVAGTHKDSYDSRYASFGLIGNQNISGRAEPIF